MEFWMTWKDKLELGLKGDAPFRRDNLPDFQKSAGGRETQPGDLTRSPEEPGARQDAVAIRPIGLRLVSKPDKPRRKREKPVDRPGGTSI
jgi:hypothetical protein